jgi:hypothetical protein
MGLWRPSGIRALVQVYVERPRFGSGSRSHSLSGACSGSRSGAAATVCHVQQRRAFRDQRVSFRMLQQHHYDSQRLLLIAPAEHTRGLPSSISNCPPHFLRSFLSLGRVSCLQLPTPLHPLRLRRRPCSSRSPRYWLPPRSRLPLPRRTRSIKRPVTKRIIP